MFEEDPDNNSNDYKQSPIFIKAKAIQKWAMAIADLANKSPVKKDGRHNLQQEYARCIIEDATIIALHQRRYNRGSKSSFSIFTIFKPLKSRCFGLTKILCSWGRITEGTFMAKLSFFASQLAPNVCN